jgi:hypothetical protein
VPYANWDTNWARFNVPGLSTNEIIARSNYWMVTQYLHTNLYDIRLLFRWPVLPRGNIGNGRQVFRTSSAGDLKSEPDARIPEVTLHFLSPRTHVRNP